MRWIFTLRFDFLFAQFPPPCHKTTTTTMQEKIPNAYNITNPPVSLLSWLECLLPLRPLLPSLLAVRCEPDTIAERAVTFASSSCGRFLPIALPHRICAMQSRTPAHRDRSLTFRPEGVLPVVTFQPIVKYTLLSRRIKECLVSVIHLRIHFLPIIQGSTCTIFM